MWKLELGHIARIFYFIYQLCLFLHIHDFAKLKSIFPCKIDVDFSLFCHILFNEYSYNQYNVFWKFQKIKLLFYGSSIIDEILYYQLNQLVLCDFLVE